eukprot:CAMPEP_0182424996 /NCGR_PEP_ID=MMETSP1167-20130531/11317_1 /TAXON_ID=2988 /ORGANISM="Mallomonas Sp, Strain CCMP3275" /LENGTH=787 /DNA_ID=CAMNT_0024605273 /DNA_START=41 /DNA_END=2404 /DNA_ORIENTATION=+
MKRNSVKVCVRTRPTHHFAQDNIKIDQNESTIQISNEPGGKDAMANNKQNNFKFKFDQVFHNATQADLYDTFARDTVQSVVDGVNGAIMSYGQTGSGKSFTMIGDTQNYEHRGIAPRAISQIFSEINSRIEFEYRISCSYMEIYNERIFDLLTDLSNPDQLQEYTVAEDRDGRGTYVRGLTDIEVASESDALNLLFSGELARTVATHKLNRRSNRSHSIFTVYLQQRQRSGISERVIHSKLHLVDLAGSERLKKTMDSIDGTTAVDDVTRKESMSINQSLTFLEQCVVALARKGTSHIPYRQSKLTNILKDCLGANCNTLLVACVWGESQHLEETVSTLRLASRMMRVLNETSTVETIDASALIKKQAKLIKALKQELSMHDALVERTGVNYEPYTPEQQATIRQMLIKYVDAPEISEEDCLNIDSYRQMIEICKQFKLMLISARQETSAAKEEYIAQLADGYVSRVNTAENIGKDEFGISKHMEDYDHAGAMVGEADTKRSGFALGTAAPDARPPTVEMGPKITDTKHSAMKQQGSSPKHVSHRSPRFDVQQARKISTVGNSSSVDTGGTFETYIHGAGSAAYEEFLERRIRLKDLKAKVKEGVTTVNEAKSTIDRLQIEIGERKDSRIELLRGSGLKASETEDIVDEDEFRLMKDLREAKRSYKNAYEQLQKDKQSLAQVQTSVEEAKQTLNFNFTAWSARKPATDTTGASVESNRLNWETGSIAESDASDQLDDQEAFDRLEVQRVLAKDPDSLPFFNAQKTRKANMTQNGAVIRQMQKNKRLI